MDQQFPWRVLEDATPSVSSAAGPPRASGAHPAAGAECSRPGGPPPARPHRTRRGGRGCGGSRRHGARRADRACAGPVRRRRVSARAEPSPRRWDARHELRSGARGRLAARWRHRGRNARGRRGGRGPPARRLPLHSGGAGCRRGRGGRRLRAAGRRGGRKQGQPRGRASRRRAGPDPVPRRHGRGRAGTRARDRGRAGASGTPRPPASSTSTRRRPKLSTPCRASGP